MACSPVSIGNSSIAAMLNAFQLGSGLCGAAITTYFIATTLIGLTLFTAWVTYGQYRQWTADRESDIRAFTGALALGFMCIASSFFLF